MVFGGREWELTENNKKETIQTLVIANLSRIDLTK